METNTASSWVVNGVSQQVIDIDKHRRHHQQPCHLPALPKEQDRQ